jgi:hypothetical protein
MPQWVTREYIARRGGAKFKPGHLEEARCPILGYTLESMKVDGQYIRRAFLKPEAQYEMGLDGYDAGAKILMDFFGKELKKFDTEDLNPLGRKIIKMFYDGASVQEFTEVIPMRF